VWVKICGIRDVATALQAAAAGGDAIGLNFYRPSPRHVPVEVAAGIVAALPAGLEPIGLFVNATIGEIAATASACGLRTLQLHGDEPPELLAELGDYRLLRAFRVGAEGVDEVAAELERLRRVGVQLRACLVDAKVSGQYGGTGARAPWEALRSWPAEWPPLILAGGLTPENVAEAIGVCRPWGVDVAGGVESSPGVKSAVRIRTFIENARNAR